jgi:hypothetical protein
MQTSSSAPLLSRVKSWQLIGLGISGWVTLYSAAIIGTSSTIAGNTQGGLFAVTMTLAGIEAKRFKKTRSTPVDPLQWTSNVTTDQLNQTIKQLVQQQEFRVEAPHPSEAGMGFGVRAVSVGRTWVFETNRWKESVIDLPHAQATDENRKRVLADFAVIVGAGTPDEDTQLFVKTHPVQIFAGEQLKNLFPPPPPPAPEIEAKPDSAPQSPTVSSGESEQAAIKTEA